jgi:hypothetical protein
LVCGYNTWGVREIGVPPGIIVLRLGFSNGKKPASDKGKAPFQESPSHLQYSSIICLDISTIYIYYPIMAYMFRYLSIGIYI